MAGTFTTFSWDFDEICCPGVPGLYQDLLEDCNTSLEEPGRWCGAFYPYWPSWPGFVLKLTVPRFLIIVDDFVIRQGPVFDRRFTHNFCSALPELDRDLMCHVLGHQMTSCKTIAMPSLFVHGYCHLLVSLLVCLFFIVVPVLLLFKSWLWSNQGCSREFSI